MNRDKENWSHKNDFPIEEVWGTYHTLSRIIMLWLKAFQALDKNGHPPDMKNIREWNQTIQKMINSFNLMQNVRVLLTKEDEFIIEQGLDLFRKYYRNLWD